MYGVLTFVTINTVIAFVGCSTANILTANYYNYVKYKRFEHFFFTC